MQTYLLNNYEISNFQSFILPVFSVYSYRHLKKACSEGVEWQGRLVHILTGLVELIPILGAIVSLIEKIIAENVKAVKPLFKIPNKDNLQNQDNEDVLMPVEESIKINQSLLKLDITPQLAETARIILSTPGFIMDPQDTIGYHPQYGHRGEEQGNQALRKIAADLTKQQVYALSPAVLRIQKEVNLEQYLTFQIKRLSHVMSMKGNAILPSGKKVNFEGFCEAFTIPMIASSFKDFSNHLSQNCKDKFRWLSKKSVGEWIVKEFNKSTSSDFMDAKKIQTLVDQIQEPDFVGPISIGTGHNWHSTFAVFFGDYLMYCNRGTLINGKPGIHFFRLPDRLLVTRQVIEELTQRQNQKPEDMFGIERIVNELGGEIIHYESMPIQQSGNCTYTSAEAALFAFIAIKYMLAFFGDNPQYLLNLDNQTWQDVFNFVRPVYDEWLKFDRELVLEDFLLDIKNIIKYRDEWQNKKELKKMYINLLKNVNSHVNQLSNLNADLIKRLSKAEAICQTL